LRVSEYFWYDPFNPEDWAGFSLENGVYQPLVRDDSQRYISQQLGLTLVRWEGKYHDFPGVWLRWATLAGELLPTAEELANLAQQEAKQAQQEAKQAQDKAAKLAEKLREMGIDPEAV